ncbi:hypothetical protein Cgig2_006919 [Carnegiea gigantea]|uniref:K+ potassium transporter integral membrane domain-containing protein n=1 Tax=Carnegiea gigantea TaxID=171969 RepID=A0A9Q1GPI0_9CARY|nr:hypothetical protein Cgig2_006919 [Carnegiea gigantea]
MDLEANNPIRRDSWRTVLTLAYQSLGVVYGDLSTSPLYHSETNEEIYGVLSFVFCILTSIPFLKYVFIVLRADDNGEGGTFALYSLLCRHARLADEELSAYKKDEFPSLDKNANSTLKSALEKHKILYKVLLILALIGTCMVIGDGVLTPALSVFSAVSRLELSTAKEQHQCMLPFRLSKSCKHIELPVVCTILILLFALQHYGAHWVGFLFAPIVITWLLCTSAVGLYNIVYWNPHVYRALSLTYIFKFLKKTQRGGWMPLGGILLCMTGSEAMFADLGHFSQLSIKIAFSFLLYPSLILAYIRQAAYLSKHHSLQSDYRIGFYVSVPGLAVITVMLVTTCLISLVIVLCWRKSVLLAVAFIFFFGSIDVLYFAASLIKFLGGAWVPIAPSFIFLIVIFLCIKSVPVPHVKSGEQFLIERIGLKEFRIYRCIARYGYGDTYKDEFVLEKDLVCSITEFIHSEKPEFKNTKETNEDDEENLTVVGSFSSNKVVKLLEEEADPSEIMVSTSEL